MTDIMKHITVEPSFFLFPIMYDLIRGLDTNLLLQKSCRFNATTEPDLNTRCDDEKRGILFISEISQKYHPIVAFICMLVTILATSWSDEAGRRRRPLIYIPILGQLFQALSGCVNSYFWHWNPITAVLSGTLFESITGGMSLMLFACQVYICDICDEKNRTMRVGFLGAVKLISMVIGKGGSGYLLRSFGFLHSYIICVAISISCLMLGLIFINDTSVPIENKIRLSRIFNLKSIVVDNFKVVFRKNLAKRRVIVFILLVTHIAATVVALGELSVLYPYLRYRFEWDERKYSGFMFYKLSISSLGVLFCSIVLSRCLKIHDGVIGALAASLDTLAITGLLFATQVWHLYLIPMIGMFYGTAKMINISFMSKYYSPNELGRLHAVLGVFSLIMPATYPIYNGIFRKTVDTFPSAFCIPSVVINITIVLCYSCSYLLSKNLQAEEFKSTLQEEMHDMITSKNHEDTNTNMKQTQRNCVDFMKLI